MAAIRRTFLAGLTAVPVLGVTGLLGASLVGRGSTGSEPSGPAPNHGSGAPFASLDRMLLHHDFLGPLSFRTGGPSHRGLQRGTGEITCLYHYGQWAWPGKPPGMEVPNSSSFIVDVTDPRIQALSGRMPPLYDAGPSGLRLHNVRTPGPLKQFTDKPWVTVTLTWQHSFGVKAPFFVEVVLRIPSVAGFWPAVWMLGADRHAVEPFDREPHLEVDYGEFFTRWPRASVAALHYTPEGGGAQIAIQDFRDRGIDFSTSFNAFAAYVGADRQVRFFINRKPVWSARFPAEARADQFLYPILSMGAGVPNVDAGVPDRSAPDVVTFEIRSLSIWGAPSTPVFRR